MSPILVNLALLFSGMVLGVAITRLVYFYRTEDLRNELDDYRKKYERLCEENITLNQLNKFEIDDNGSSGNDATPNYFKPF